MDNKKAILAIKDFIVTSEKALKSAKKLLNDLAKENNIDLTKEVKLNTNWLHNYSDNEVKVIEWVFTWEEMLGSDWKKYPVPANYASKSKMVQWDKLKLTIDKTWKMTYKQIWPIERETRVWLLTEDKGRYQVVCDWDVYNVLTAAVTHFKAEIWDSLSVLLPKWKQASFAAIDAVIPKE